MHTKQVGDLGERLAAEYLKNKGYRILAQNYSFWIPGNPRKGEIDIVAQKGDLITFFEVKTLRLARRAMRTASSSLPADLLRKNSVNDGSRTSIISPEQRVDFSKMKKLVRTAESWLVKNKIPLNSKWQIDILAIEIENDGPAFAKATAGKVKISHFENAVASLI